MNNAQRAARSKALSQLAAHLRTAIIGGSARGSFRQVHGGVLVMLGAGASVAAGIPDFRGKGGLYERIRERAGRNNKPSVTCPEDVFSLYLFRRDPSIFYQMAHAISLWPSADTAPTLVHHFVAMLAERNALYRCYTQNIDGLERYAFELGLRRNKLTGTEAKRVVEEQFVKSANPLIVEAHGTLMSAHCTCCGQLNNMRSVLSAAQDGEVPTCEHCISGNKQGNLGVPKPDVTFFGEAMPQPFIQALSHDRAVCQDYESGDDHARPPISLCLVIGTSMQVKPFAGIPRILPGNTPRALLNEALVASDIELDTRGLKYQPCEARHASFRRNHTFEFRSQDEPFDYELVDGLLNKKLPERPETSVSVVGGGRGDVFIGGDAQATIEEISGLLGWREELHERVQLGKTPCKDI